MGIAGAVIFAFFAFVILKAIIRYLYSDVIKVLWRVRWKEIPRKDIVKSVAAACFIVLFETALPSTALTGREPLPARTVTYPEVPAAGGQISLTSAEVAELTPWLSTLAESPAYLEAEKKRLNAQLEDLEDARESLALEFEHAERILAAAKSGNPGWETDEAKRERVRRLENEAKSLSVKLSANQWRLQRLKRSADKNSHKIRRHTSDQEFLRFRSPVELASGRQKNVPGDVLTGPVVNKRGSTLKYAVELLRGDHRGEVEAVTDYSCRLEIDPDVSVEPRAKKVCDVLLPLLVKYDVTLADCPPDEQRRIPPDVLKLDMGAGCLERWSYPSLLVRLDEEGIMFLPPKSGVHATRLTDQEHLPITKWEVQIDSKVFPLDGRTKIAWRNFPMVERAAEWKLVHRPRTDRIAPRWWRDFAFDTRYMGFPKHFLTSDDYEARHKFGVVSVPVGSKNVLLDAALFVHDARMLSSQNRSRLRNFLAGYADDLYAYHFVSDNSSCRMQESWSRAIDLILGRDSKFTPYSPANLQVKKLRRKSRLAIIRRPRIAVYANGTNTFDCRQADAAFVFLTEALAQTTKTE